MHAQPLTPTQAETYIALRGYFDREGQAPTLSEAAEFLGVYPRAVAESVEILARKGWIERKPHEARGMVFLQPAEDAARSLHPESPHARACLVLMG